MDNGLEKFISNYKKIALCGYRNAGKELFKSLMDLDIEITYIIERNYEAFAQLYGEIDTKIVGFHESPDFYAEAEAILLSGDLPEELVKECLALAGIKLPVIKYMG